MFLLRLFGITLIIAIVIFAAFLYRGATKIEKMILEENKETGDD